MLRRALFVLPLLAALSCQSSPDPDPGSGDPSVTAVTVEAPATLTSGAAAQLRATVAGQGAFDDGVTWTVSAGNLAQAASNPADYTAPQVSVETTVTVTATSTADPTKSDSAEIAVRPVSLGEFEPRVEQAVQPEQPSVVDQAGNASNVARSVDALGVASDFVEGVVLLRPTSDAQLTEFLERYDGAVVADDTIPEPPPQLGITLTAEQRRPTEYLVRINLDLLAPGDLTENGRTAGLEGTLTFSSEEAMLTMAGVADAVASGYDVSPEYLSRMTQTFPQTLFSTQERPSGMTFADAFTTNRYQATGSQSNVTAAWQFVAAHGIERRVRVATVDDGYWLDTAGNPLGADSDLPANPVQYDFMNNDYIADGPNATGCGAGNPCFWHGTGAIGVATGIANNQRGAAGTGGFIADPMLMKASGRRSVLNWAIRTALAWGADVISMSFGGDCNQACRIYDREHTPFSDAVGAGSRTVFVAAAGNGDAAGNGYSVGDPAFVHPCIEGHVICVGALADNTTNKIGYSNFGGQVLVFAPTNIPVMSQPAGNDNNPAGPAAPRNFGGTSASTPFVAGVAAMMKAINPNLSSDDVARILSETAPPGAAPVNRYIDALAAVRRAAEGREGVRDRYDGGGGNGTTPTNLGTAGSYLQNNLSLHQPGDVDLYTFTVPGRSTMTVDLLFPGALGAVWVQDFETDGTCGLPAFVGEAAITNGRRYTYTTGGGAYTVRVRGDALNAYNLAINFAAAALTPDDYEANDTVATARWIYSFKVGPGKFAPILREPRVTIAANIHAPTDIDWYLVRGVQMNGGERFLLDGYPGLRLAGNESNMSMEVYAQNADGSLGPLRNTAGGASCSPNAFTIPLEEGVYYFVRVAGSPGRYSLRNGVYGNVRKFPVLVRDSLYEILHPGDPIEYIVREPSWYVFVANPRYRQLFADGDRFRIELFDFDGARLAEGAIGEGGFQRVDLASTVPDGIYAVLITPEEGETFVQLGWNEADPVRATDNLVRNGTAEEGEGNDANGPVEEIPDWVALATPGIAQDGAPPIPTVIYYNGVQGVPAADSPGPEERGDKLFAGGPYELSGMQQGILLPEGWAEAVGAGRVQARISAYLGGTVDEGDYVEATLQFVDPNLQELGAVALPTVTAVEREYETGLLPVAATAEVPPNTYAMIVSLVFYRENFQYADGYADNIELRLEEYGD